MAAKCFVTGSTGNVGREVVEHLRIAGIPVIGAKRPGKNPPALEGVQFLDFDFTDSSTWEKCLDGVESVFLMRPPHISKIKRDMEPFMSYMKERGIRHVVFLSVQGAEGNKMVPHYDVEQTCISLGLPYTFIRPSFFMQNLTTTHLKEIRDDKMVFVPTGKGKTNFIDVRDIGEVMAKMLMDDEKIGKAYTITGEKSYSYKEIAEHLSIGLGEEIRFVNPGIPRFIARNLREGRKFMMTLVMVALYTVVKLGKGDITTDESEKILGRKTRSLDDFIADNRNLLKGSAQ